MITSVLVRSASSPMPVPRPVTSLAGSPSPAATIAAAGVVLPMPMSPLISSCAPLAISSRVTAAPALSAALVSSALSASSRWIAPLPRRILCRVSASRVVASRSSNSSSTPRSSTRTWTPWACASALTPARPPRNVRTIAPVIAGGNAETPCWATPWSPAKITRRTLSTDRGGTSPWHAATQTASSPRRPRAPGGVARAPSRSAATRRTSSFGVWIVTRARYPTPPRRH